MKKLFYILLFSLIFVGCKSTFSREEKIMLNPNKVSAQEYYDNIIRHSVIKDSAGHTLIFHEVGSRGCYNYSFSIEHSSECKLCYDIYD